MENELFSQGLNLMLAGMGTVFVFLTLLVIVTTIMSRLIMRMQPGAAASPHAGDPLDEELAAVAAAIQQHRQSSR